MLRSMMLGAARVTIITGVLAATMGCDGDDDLARPPCTMTPAPSPTPVPAASNTPTHTGTVAPVATPTPVPATATATQAPTDTPTRSPEEEARAATGTCINCHAGIEAAHPKYPLGCTHCHAGDPDALTKQTAHVLPQAPLPQNATILPADYFDRAYLQFLNPTNLRVAPSTCGRSGMGGAACHASYVDDVLKSMMATTTGHLTGGAYQNGILPDRTAIWGNMPVRDDDGEVPGERGALRALEQLPAEDPSFAADTFQHHYGEVPRKVCARCHLWSRGAALRGVPGQEGNYRSEGCAACHMPYTNAALSESGDPTIDKLEVGHPRLHQLTRQIPTDQCAHCHIRGARIGLSYRGLAQSAPGTATGPNYPGLTPEKIHGAYYVQNPAVIPPDAHHERGLHCIDCHVREELMGDGNIYGHMDQATEVECEDCHGTPTEYGPMATSRGTALSHLRWEDGTMVLTSKVTGARHVVKQVKDIVDPAHPSYNPLAATAMNADHLKEGGGLECYACHSGWQNNCYGCHFKRDLTQSALDMIAGTETPGKPTLDDRYFVNYKNFHMGYNGEGKIAPYVTGCQVLATVIDETGREIMRQQLPITAAGLSGLALNPVHPHTNRRSARACVECHRNPSALGLGTDGFNLSRTHLFALTPDSLAVINRQDVTTASVVASLALPSPRRLAVATDQIDGTAKAAYIADGSSGLLAVDLADPLDPVVASTTPVADPRDVALAGRTLYLAAGADGLQTYDLSEPLQPRLVGSLPTAEARAVAVHGLHVLIADGTGSLVIADVRSPGAPVLLSTLDLNGDDPAANDASGVFPMPHYSNPTRAGLKPFAMMAYVAAGASGVLVVNIDDLRAPYVAAAIPAADARAVFVKSHFVPGDSTTPSLEREFAYVADGAGGLLVADVSNPWSPRLVTSFAAAGAVYDLRVANAFEPPKNKAYLYAGLGAAGLAIIDVSEATAPAVVRTLPIEVTQGIDLERVWLDRMVDEDGRQIKDVSHDGARPLRREEMQRILDARL